MVRCKDCKWWNRDDRGLGDHLYCCCPGLDSHTVGGLAGERDGADTDDGYGRIVTGPEFGCIHGEGT